MIVVGGHGVQLRHGIESRGWGFEFFEYWRGDVHDLLPSALRRLGDVITVRIERGVRREEVTPGPDGHDLP